MRKITLKITRAWSMPCADGSPVLPVAVRQSGKTTREKPSVVVWEFDWRKHRAAMRLVKEMAKCYSEFPTQASYLDDWAKRAWKIVGGKP